MKTPPIRVIVADDDPIVRELLRRILHRHAHIQLVAEASDGDEAVALCKATTPDILLLDLLMPRLPGMDALRELSTEAVPVRPIVLCAFAGTRQVVQALQLGARAVLLKKSLHRLIPCIEAVMDGGYWIDDRRLSTVEDVIAERLRRHAAETPPMRTFRLTRREMQIVSLVTLGRTNREIGSALSISEETVKRHLANIFDKVGMSTRLEVAMFAIDHGLVSI